MQPNQVNQLLLLTKTINPCHRPNIIKASVIYLESEMTGTEWVSLFRYVRKRAERSIVIMSYMLSCFICFAHLLNCSTCFLLSNNSSSSSWQTVWSIQGQVVPCRARLRGWCGLAGWRTVSWPWYRVRMARRLSISSWDNKTKEGQKKRIYSAAEAQQRKERWFRWGKKRQDISMFERIQVNYLVHMTK